MNGTINVLKPVGMTSADVVYHLKKKLNVSKIGHTGTLDPGASGVLPICIGKGTRLAEYYTSQNKSYRAELTLGIETDTEDAFGNVLKTTLPQVKKEEFVKVIKGFIGKIGQIPPMYSSVRKNGKHLYEYARKGIEIERTPRNIEIFSINIIKWSEDEYPRALFDVICSKGTYIRTLCSDIGNKLGCGAHMSFLLRLSSGSFRIEDAWTFEEIEKAIENKECNYVNPLSFGLNLPIIELPDFRVKAFCCGLPTDKNCLNNDDFNNGTSVQVVNDNKLLGVGIWKDNRLYANKVLS
ncbi:MAG: tRNA pseudouridine(55) synthase TruB [Eubacteriales bacterium]